MDKLIILSDIHANLTALLAVLDDAFSKYQPDAIVSLGDIVNYGMRPIEVSYGYHRNLHSVPTRRFSNACRLFCTLYIFYLYFHGRKKYSSILNSVCNRYHLDNVFQIYEILGLSSPMIFSMHKPIILLPIENEYSVEELTFIFRHEL